LDEITNVFLMLPPYLGILLMRLHEFLPFRPFKNPTFNESLSADIIEDILLSPLNVVSCELKYTPILSKPFQSRRRQYDRAGGILRQRTG